MRLFANHRCREVLVCGTLLAFGGLPSVLQAQDAAAQGTSRSDIVTFDGFLDAHADIDAQLRANPSLLTNAEFLESHPQLEAFLNEHPSIQTQVKDNPSFFMQRQQRFDAQENRRATNPNPDLSRREVGTMDQFLDKNPNIDRDLRANPSLVNDASYLRAHPQLQAFLDQHPNVKEEIVENPRYFMQRENRFDAQEPGRRAGNPNPDLNRQEVATMDQFLDKNPNIERDLSKNPSLVNNAEYLEAHPQLQAFLNQHPNVKDEIAENPRYFMQRENRFEANERDRRAARPNPNPDLTRQEVAEMDQFLDSHPDIDKTLRANPWLVRNAVYLKEHPELQNFLNQHPGLREESSETPSYLMDREKRFEAHEPSRSDRDRDARTDRDQDRDANGRDDRDANRDRDANARNDRDRDRDATASNDRDRNGRDLDRDQNRDADRDRDANRTRDLDRRSNPNPDLTSQEVATMDSFLDRHEDIAKSLEKKPELINDRNYLKRHKDLSEFLSEHPAVREEVRENPSYFMRRENQLEARNMDREARDRDRVAPSRDRDSRDLDGDLNKKELQDMDRFLDKHKKIEKDLQRNPSLVKDEDYLRHHKSLESFLSKNPRVGEEIRENPSAFMRQQQRLEEHNHRMSNQPAVKPKTKTEQKEEMHTATPH